MQSRFFENTLAELLESMGSYSELTLRRCLAHSRMLSSDVTAGYDALYASAYDKKNVAYLGKGMVFNKFTGARGKSGSNDANAEYLGDIRAMMDKHKVHFQTSELVNCPCKKFSASSPIMRIKPKCERSHKIAPRGGMRRSKSGLPNEINESPENSAPRLMRNSFHSGFIEIPQPQ